MLPLLLLRNNKSSSSAHKNDLLILLLDCFLSFPHLVRCPHTRSVCRSLNLATGEVTRAPHRLDEPTQDSTKGRRHIHNRRRRRRGRILFAEMARRSPPRHRHDGTSPLPLGIDFSPAPSRWVRLAFSLFLSLSNSMAPPCAMYVCVDPREWRCD